MVINSLPYTPETCNHFTCRKEDRFKIGPPFLCKAAPLLHKLQTPPPFPPTGRYDFRPRNDGFRFPISAHIIFFGEDCIYTVVVQHYTQPQTNTGIFEKDDTPVEQYVYHQVSHYIFSNNGSTTAAWMVGDTEYYMFASDGAEDMKALIRQVRG